MYILGNSRMNALVPGSQRVLDDEERQRARERGIEADHKRKERTLISLQERPQSSGAMLKTTTVVRPAMPPSASAPGMSSRLLTLGHWRIWQYKGLMGNLLSGLHLPVSLPCQVPTLPTTCVKAVIRGGAYSQQGSQMGVGVGGESRGLVFFWPSRLVSDGGGLNGITLLGMGQLIFVRPRAPYRRRGNLLVRDWMQACTYTVSLSWHVRQQPVAMLQPSALITSGRRGCGSSRRLVALT